MLHEKPLSSLDAKQVLSF